MTWGEATAPLISVVVAAYNHERYVGEMARSVLDQTIDDLELIVADDGSVDGTVQVLEDVARSDERMAVLRHPGGVHRGRVPTMTLGMRHARGRYVGVLGSDDRWWPDKLKAQLPALEDGAALSYGLARRIGPAGEPLPGVVGLPHEAHDPQPLEALLIGNFLPTSSAMFPRELYERAGGFDQGQPYEDYDLWLRLVCLGGVHFSARILCDYRLLDTSVDTRIRRAGEDLDAMLRAMEHLLGWDGLPADRAPSVRAWARCYRSLVWLIHGRDDRSLGALEPEDAPRLARLVFFKRERLLALVDRESLWRWGRRLARLGRPFRRALLPRLRAMGVTAPPAWRRAPAALRRTGGRPRRGTRPAGLLGSLDEPRLGEIVPRGPVEVRGWALDPGGPVREVLVGTGERDPTTEARLGLPRPDVAAAHPQVPGARVAGWRAELDLTDVPEGTTEIVAVARDAAGEPATVGRTLVRVVGPGRAPRAERSEELSPPGGPRRAGGTGASG